jgi:hypothetical protein
VFYSSAVYIQYIQSFVQSRLSTADYALLAIISPNYRGSLEKTGARADEREREKKGGGVVRDTTVLERGVIET